MYIFFLFIILVLYLAAAMGAVFGFFMGSLSQMSSPVMTGTATQAIQGSKQSVASEVSVFCTSSCFSLKNQCALHI